MTLSGPGVFLFIGYYSLLLQIFLNRPSKVTFALNVCRSFKAGLIQDKLKCVDGETKS